MICGPGLIGESSAIECVKEKIPGAIAGEGASGAIAAMSRRSEANDKELRVHVAKSRNGPSPVVPIEKGPAPGASDGFAIPHETRTLATRNDFVV